VGDLLRRLKRLYPWLKVVFADSVYDRLAALLACFLLGLTLVVIRRLAGTEGFVLVPRRWVAIACTELPNRGSSGPRRSSEGGCARWAMTTAVRG
jgi:hypothetical protein